MSPLGLNITLKGFSKNILQIQGDALASGIHILDSDFDIVSWWIEYGSYRKLLGCLFSSFCDIYFSTHNLPKFASIKYEILIRVLSDNYLSVLPCCCPSAKVNFIFVRWILFLFVWFVFGVSEARRRTSKALKLFKENKQSCFGRIHFRLFFFRVYPFTRPPIHHLRGNSTWSPIIVVRPLFQLW